MDKKMLNDTKMFEKIEIGWFSIADMKNKRNDFRKFYQDMVDFIIKDQANIMKFLPSNRRLSKTVKR